MANNVFTPSASSAAGFSYVGPQTSDPDDYDAFSLSTIPPLTAKFVMNPLISQVMFLTREVENLAPIDLQTDGVSNADQTTLNIIAGDNVTLTADENGGVTIDATGGGGGGVGNPMTENLDCGNFQLLNVNDVVTSNVTTSTITASAWIATPANGLTIGGEDAATRQGSPNFTNGLTVFGGSPAQMAAIPDASGGVVVDSECRAALNDLLAKLRTWGPLASA